jgi:uncharacterized protein (DUF362 family)
MVDQLGGLQKLVAGKTVAVKVNLTGDVHQPALGLPPGRTYHVHPQVVLATATLLDRAGAQWLPLAAQKPGLLLAGRNAICTDAIATAVMGYDPRANSATGAFPGDNHLAMAAALGLGTNEPQEIEVRGLSGKEALHPFRWEPRRRNT